MSPSVVVDDVSSPLSSPLKKRTRLSHDFRRYEVTVMATTQLSYIPVTATMLCTAFFEPGPDYCRQTNRNGTFSPPAAEKFLDFHSLLVDWGAACQHSAVVTLMSIALMTGALVGAFVAGWLADLYGRRPVVKGCLLMIGLGNVAVALFSYFSPQLTAFLFFLLGTACGGYMVVNLVMFVECLELPRSRLLAVSTNGWSISMSFVALIAWLSYHWSTYHFVVAGTAFAALFATNFLLVESCRWLDSVLRTTDAHQTALTVATWNNYKVQPDWPWWQVLRFSPSAAHQKHSEPQNTCKTYNYLDLFRSSRVCLPLLSLAYCFIASSVVSFGFYFNLDVLPGNRFSNMALMGISKFVMGWIPFFVSAWIGRKPVVLTSVAVAMTSAWCGCLLYWFEVPPLHNAHAFFSLLVSASLDPTWKINHLYSTELFPTAVRNMARAICNVGARFGSVIAPMVVHLRFLHPSIPIAIFALILTVQLLVTVVFLPETKNSPLPADFPPKKEEEADVEMFTPPSSPRLHGNPDC